MQDLWKQATIRVDRHYGNDPETWPDDARLHFDRELHRHPGFIVAEERCGCDYSALNRAFTLIKTIKLTKEDPADG